MKPDELVDSTRSKGTRYERLAEEFLVKKGFRVVQRNYRYGKAEIDIILKQDKLLVFTEVKYRHSEEFGKPYMFISRTQKINIIKAGVYFIRLNKEFSDFTYRFDVVTFTGDSEVPEYYPNAFTIDEFKFIKAL